MIIITIIHYQLFMICFKRFQNHNGRWNCLNFVLQRKSMQYLNKNCVFILFFQFLRTETVCWVKLVLICFITALSCLKQEKCNELRKVLTTKICINGYFITLSHFVRSSNIFFTILLYEKHQPHGIKHHVVKVTNDTHYKMWQIA